MERVRGQNLTNSCERGVETGVLAVEIIDPRKIDIIYSKSNIYTDIYFVLTIQKLRSGPSNYPQVTFNIYLEGYRTEPSAQKAVLSLHILWQGFSKVENCLTQ